MTRGHRLRGIAYSSSDSDECCGPLPSTTQSSKGGVLAELTARNLISPKRRKGSKRTSFFNRTTKDDVQIFEEFTFRQVNKHTNITLKAKMGFEKSHIYIFFLTNKYITYFLVEEKTSVSNLVCILIFFWNVSSHFCFPSVQFNIQQLVLHSHQS